MLENLHLFGLERVSGGPHSGFCRGPCKKAPYAVCLQFRIVFNGVLRRQIGFAWECLKGPWPVNP